MALPALKKCALAVAVVLLTACGGGGGGSSAPAPTPDPDPTPTPTPTPTPGEFSQTALIASIVDNVYIPTFEMFAQRAQSLNTAVDAYCAALPSDTNNARAAAQTSWQQAMDTWQMIDLMQVGPLAENNNELRNRVYSWPDSNACLVDQDVVEAESAGYDITARTAPRKGLDALEYVLFDNDLNHKCTVAGLEPVGWNDRTDEDRTQARCDFAAIAASDVVAGANAIVTAWTGDNGYGNVLKAAGEQGSSFSTSLEAINDISDALFYFTGPVKDGKIATPLGLRANNCGLTACPEDAEAVYSDYSLANIINNIRALRLVLVGGETNNTGFIDFLNDEGDTTTATNIIAAIDEAIAQAESLNASFSQALTQNAAGVQQLHDEVNDVDDIMKSDFINSLSLELPATSAGDND